MTNNKDLKLNIVPINFSSDVITAGKMPNMAPDDYLKLQEEHWNTHIFRYDNRTNEILNIPINTEVKPLGEVVSLEISDHLLLLGKAIQHSLLVWLANRVPILYNNNKKLIFLGQVDDSLLLSRVLENFGIVKTPGLEVVLRYEVDCRVFESKSELPYLGLIIDISTVNIIDMPISILISKGFKIQNHYVCRKETPHQEYLEPKLEFLGSVIKIEGDEIYINSSEGILKEKTNEIYLEPRQEYFKEILKIFFQTKAQDVIKALDMARNPIQNANGKLQRIRRTLVTIKSNNIELSNAVRVNFGELLNPNDEKFPQEITTTRPTFLFGAQGRSNGTSPDVGIMNHGPYMYMQHERNEPTIGVICESQFKGRVEQFMKMLLHGFPNDSWTNQRKDNPFPNGLIGKYRLYREHIVYEEITGSPTAENYKITAKKLLTQLHTIPDIVIVQVRAAHKDLFGDENPYFASKAYLMQAGIPTQSVQIEKMEIQEALPYLLNNISLAIYAKLDGIPWVISTIRPTTHEIVIGLGSATIMESRLGSKRRYVGITSVFQGDGKYLVWGSTREVEFEKYSEALLENLLSIVKFVKERNAWQIGDRVRIICHVYKRLQNLEIETIKLLVSKLTQDQLSVEFAFLDISWYHPYHIFAPNQKGRKYWDIQTRQWLIKGVGVPERGFSLRLGKSRCLMQLTGPNDVKTSSQGLPKPLLVELHPSSDFVDMTYLTRQIYHFCYMSWRSFFPSTEPITITYSKLIARLLGNLKAIPDWNSNVITVGSLRGRKWFL